MRIDQHGIRHPDVPQAEVLPFQLMLVQLEDAGAQAMRCQHMQELVQDGFIPQSRLTYAPQAFSWQTILQPAIDGGGRAHHFDFGG